jgi:hypothetical protein
MEGQRVAVKPSVGVEVLELAHLGKGAVEAEREQGQQQVDLPKPRVLGTLSGELKLRWAPVLHRVPVSKKRMRSLSAGCEAKPKAALSPSRSGMAFFNAANRRTISRGSMPAARVR